MGAGYGRRVLRRVVGAVFTLTLTILALLMVTFALSSLSPVDPAIRLVGDHASTASYQQARRELGLDKPWPVQFERYVSHALRGDLGISASTGQPVRDDLASVFPATLELATLAMLVSAVVGLVFGLLGAWRPGGLMDSVIRILSLAGNSIPIFWLGLLSLYLFYAHLHWTGGPGRLGDAFEYSIDQTTGLVLIDTWRSGVPGAFANAMAHLVLPVLVLAANTLGNIARMTRAALLDETDREYVILARAKGAGEARVLLGHILPNAAGTVLTVLALSYARLLEGAVLTETVFAWPGLGRYLTTALFAADIPAILGGTLVIGVCFVVLNRCTDLLVRAVDPRIP
jgi:peptide/nickel transport system permease protein